MTARGVKKDYEEVKKGEKKRGKRKKYEDEKATAKAVTSGAKKGVGKGKQRGKREAEETKHKVEEKFESSLKGPVSKLKKASQTKPKKKVTEKTGDGIAKSLDRIVDTLKKNASGIARVASVIVSFRNAKKRYADRKAFKDAKKEFARRVKEQADPSDKLKLNQAAVEYGWRKVKRGFVRSVITAAYSLSNLATFIIGPASAIVSLCTGIFKGLMLLFDALKALWKIRVGTRGKGREKKARTIVNSAINEKDDTMRKLIYDLKPWNEQKIEKDMRDTLGKKNVPPDEKNFKKYLGKLAKRSKKDESIKELKGFVKEKMKST